MPLNVGKGAISVGLIMPLNVGKGAISVVFVHLSLCLSVCRIHSK